MSYVDCVLQNEAQNNGIHVTSKNTQFNPIPANLTHHQRGYQPPISQTAMSQDQETDETFPKPEPIQEEIPPAKSHYINHNPHAAPTDIPRRLYR
jgi:hypothetical protein